MKEILTYRTICKFGISSFIASLMFLCTSCSSFDKKVDGFIRDGKVTEEEWGEIVTVLKHDQQKYPEFFSEGQLNVAGLQAYIQQRAKETLRGVDTISFEIVEVPASLGSSVLTTSLLDVKLFLERSGSMTPFDDSQTKGEFKTAVVGLLNSLPKSSAKSTVFVVNNAVYPYQHSLMDLIRSKNIFQETEGIGDVRYTDFACIFDSILNRTQEGELSLLVSDMLYSTKDMASVNPQKILNEAQSITASVFKGHNDKDVLILKLWSSYCGKYYSFNSPNKGIPYEGNRPYYIMIVGSKVAMNAVFFDKRYSDFSNFEHLPGFENYYCFSQRGNENPYYSVLLNDSHNKGRFKAEKGSNTTVHSIEDVEEDRDGGFSLAVAIDLSKLYVDDAYKMDTANYMIESSSAFGISDIVVVTPDNTTPTISRYAPDATHLIVLKGHGPIKSQSIKLSLLNRFPDWFRESSSEDDRDMKDPTFATTTFAFENLMRGIYESYYSTTEVPTYLKININLKK